MNDGISTVQHLRKKTHVRCMQDSTPYTIYRFVEDIGPQDSFNATLEDLTNMWVSGMRIVIFVTGRITESSESIDIHMCIRNGMAKEDRDLKDFVVSLCDMP